VLGTSSKIYPNLICDIKDHSKSECYNLAAMFSLAQVRLGQKYLTLICTLASYIHTTSLMMGQKARVFGPDNFFQSSLIFEYKLGWRCPILHGSYSYLWGTNTLAFLLPSVTKKKVSYFDKHSSFFHRN